MKRHLVAISGSLIVFGVLCFGGLRTAAQWNGRTGVGVPVATERGSWEGTWFHIQRDKKAAVWIRQEGNGKPQIRIQFFSNLGDEQFHTGWDSKAAYQARGTTGYFTLIVNEGDENFIDADWDWKLEFPDSGRTETSHVRIYRTGDGRGMAFHFEDWVQSIRRGSHVQKLESPHVWTFRKISRRELIWDELPL